jgi:hypothetical protein
MQVRWLVIPVGLAAGCTGQQPTWATDPIWLEPEPIGGDGIHGFQTWELYGKRWTRQYAEKHFVCSVLIEFTGAPVDPGASCTGCEMAWTVESERVDSDCGPRDVDRAGFLALTGVALGEKGANLDGGDPYPEQSLGAFVDYATGTWEPYGWGVPDTAESESATWEWNGEQAFVLQPGWYWELDAP